MQLFVVMLLLVPVYLSPVRRNKAFQRASLAYPALFQMTTLQSATDGVMTNWEPNNQNYWQGYVFQTTLTTPGIAKLEINIDQSTIRTILISARENSILTQPEYSSIGIQISIGETQATSTVCYTLLSGISTWFTCNGFYGVTGSKIFVVQIVNQCVNLFELQAFEQQNVILNAQISGYTLPEISSSPTNFLKQEMHIQDGDAITCYLSQFASMPFIKLTFKAAIQFTTANLVGMIPKTTPPPTNSAMYSSNLIVEIYKFGALQGTCTPLKAPFDPLLDAEQDCNNIVGNEVIIYRQCLTPTCQLGLCGALILSDCDCSKTQFDLDNINPLYYSGQILNVTKIEIKLNGQGVYIQAKFAQYNDSVSLVCGDATGTKFCGNRVPIIWDINKNSEIDLSSSTLLKLDIATGVMLVQTSNLLDVGTHSFKFGVKLSDYSADAYFPQESEFTVQVSHTTTIYPNFETNYTYTIGSQMTPLVYTVSKAAGTSQITVNGDDDNIGKTYGVIMSQETSGADILIYISSLYFDTDLADQKLQIILTFIQSSNTTYTFPTITATYLNDNTPPHFKVAKLSDSLPIPCLSSPNASKWEYKFPPVSDKQHDTIKLVFECQELANIVFFNQQKMLLQLISKQSDQQPPSGNYKSLVTLYDSNSASQSYELGLSVDCRSNNISSSFNRTNTQNTTKIQTSKSQAPVPAIYEITSSGVIRICWDQNIQQSSDLPISVTAQLQNGKVRFPPSTYLDQLIQVKIIQRSDPEVVPAEKLQFIFSFEWVNSTTSDIIIHFDNPVYISNGKIRDQVEIVVKKPSYFKSAKAPYQSVQPNLTLKHEIPRQLSPNSQKIDAKTIASLSVTFLWTSVITEIFFAGVMGAILSFLPHVVLVVHMFASSLNFPVNLQEFLSGLFPLLTMNILPTDYIYGQIFEFSALQDGPLSDQFAAIGYNYTLSVRNLQSIFLIIIIQPVITLVLYVTNKLLQNYKQKKRWLNCIQNRINNYLQSMIWNGIISFFQQNSFVISVIALIQFTQLRLNNEQTATEKFCSSLAIVLYTNTWVLPIVVLTLYIFMIKSSIPLPDLNDEMTMEEIKYFFNTENIESIQKNAYTQNKHQKLMKRFGVVIEGIKLDQLKKQMTFFIGFLTFSRQIILSFGVVYFRESPTFLIFLFNSASLIVVGIMVNYQPYVNKMEQNFKVLQEIGLLIINYQQFCFTGWADLESAVFVGNLTIYTLIAEIVTFFMIGITPLILQQILLLKRQLYRYQTKKKLTMKQTLQILKQKHAPSQVQPDDQSQNISIPQCRKLIIFNESNFFNIPESVEMAQQVKESLQMNPSGESSYSEEFKSKHTNQLSRNFQLGEDLQSYSISEELTNIEILAANDTNQVQENQFEEIGLKVSQKQKSVTFRIINNFQDQVLKRQQLQNNSEDESRVYRITYD